MGKRLQSSPILWLLFSVSVLVETSIVGQLVLVLLVAADGLELGVVVVVDRFSRSCQGRLSLDMARLDLWMVAEAMRELSGIYLLHGICRYIFERFVSILSRDKYINGFLYT